ncbi:hypothetical protein OROHE_026561 [Orobanche hederae]
MAYAALVSLSQTILQILNHDRYPLSDNGTQQIESLRKQVILLQIFLEKFPTKANGLETRIRDAANEAEELLEHFMYDKISSRYNKSIRITSNVAKPYDFHELETVTEEINSITRETVGVKSLIGRENVANSSPTPAPAVGRVTNDLSVTVGLDEDLEKLKDLLYGGWSKCQQKRQIIPIVGVGGIGKTTLASHAYQDPLIMESFPVRAWVRVSLDYKAQDIFSDLLQSFEENDAERCGRSSDTVQDRVYKYLKGRKYLIVLDDLWSFKAWDDFKNIFPDDCNGSRIMITTRLHNVASYADSSNLLHQMRFIDPVQSWDLLKRVVFPNKDIPPELESIGYDIAKRCGGLPLAVVLVAGILSTVSKTRLSWKEVERNIELVADREGQFEKVISLSYTHLPHHLRSCFLYMGIFPKDYEIHVSRLIKLWVAERFVEPRAGKSLEEGAEEYLEDLVKRSLALVIRRKSNGNIKICNVHDLVRDFCKRKAQHENFQRLRELTMCLDKTYNGSTLRSVLCSRASESSLSALQNFRLLRVLDMVDANIKSLPDQIFEMFHLRYLAFDCPVKIPAAISRLQNLHTLIICPRRKSKKYSMDELCLPLEIWTMPLLTHLVSFFALLPIPQGEGEASLGNLLTLSAVKGLICTKEMTEMIPNLKKLGITYFGDQHQKYSQLHNLVLLHQLEKLKLVMQDYSVARLNANPVFPETLKKLTLSGWLFPWKYMEIIGALPNLQVLKLRCFACKGDTWETNENQFPSLEFLLIDSSDLEIWVTETSHFPRLKCLVLYSCALLREIPNDIGEIATLELIEVDHASKSLVECVKQIQEEQRDNGNDTLQVHCVRPLQKIVIRIPLHCQKCKAKALKIAVQDSGVESVQLDNETNQLVVVGVEVDVIRLTSSLRKKVGHATLETIEELNI